MKKLALITLILLFLMIFTSLTKLFSGNCFNNDFFAKEKYEMKKPGCLIIFSSFNKPAGCFCEHLQKNSLEENLSTGLFHDADKKYSIVTPGKFKKYTEYEFHNTSETTIGYFLIQ